VTTLTPIHDRVLIKRKAAKTETASGLFIPEPAQEKNNLAVVVATGPGRTMENGSLVPMTVEEGMTVLIGKWSGDEVQVEGVDHLIIREADIFAIVEE